MTPPQRSVTGRNAGAEPASAAIQLRTRLAQDRLLIVPGVHDMIAALLAKKAGFEFIYGSGFWLTASCYGLPDAGIVGYAEMKERMTALVRVAGPQVIADADTGYGGLLNVHHTVRGYEDIGVAAIQIEDQVFPKRCGHTPNKQVIPTDEMVDKIRVACDARRSPDTLIIARTDAREEQGLADAVHRAQAYDAAGADMIFVEGLHDAHEMRLACSEVSGLMMANMSHGGYSPMLSADELQDIGYACAIYPALTGLVSTYAMTRALENLRAGKATSDVGVADFGDFCEMIGFTEVWAFDKKWAR
jgi:2-methylisocitrate lyase-like PEP mutase family enzyme